MDDILKFIAVCIACSYIVSWLTTIIGQRDLQRCEQRSVEYGMFSVISGMCLRNLYGIASRITSSQGTVAFVPSMVQRDMR